MSATLGVFVPARAVACSFRSCAYSALAPSNGVTVPANLPAATATWGGGGIGVSPTLTIKDDTGATVPLSGPSRLTSGPLFFSLSTPLVEGVTYTLSTPEPTCDGSSQTTFRAVAAAPFPASIGSATATASRIEQQDVGTVSGSCTSPATVGVTDITVTPTPALDAWLGVTSFDVKVDGQDQTGAVFGSLSPGKPVTFQLFTTCHAADKGVYGGVGAGTHHVAIDASIAGATTTLSPIELDVTLDCTDSGGCSLTPHGTPRCLHAVLSVALLGLALHVRRSSRWRAAPARRD